jgi:hypothetical protein
LASSSASILARYSLRARLQFARRFLVEALDACEFLESTAPVPRPSEAFRGEQLADHSSTSSASMNSLLRSANSFCRRSILPAR